MRSKDTILRLHRFKHEAKRRQVADIELMITEFLKKQDELDAHIRMEESRNGVSDPGHFNYSTAAKAARARRDNLLRSVGELKDQLDTARGALARRGSGTAQNRAAGREGRRLPPRDAPRPQDGFPSPGRRCAEPYC